MGDRRRERLGSLPDLRRSISVRRWLLLPSLLVALTSCAVVPTGGPVLEGEPVRPADAPAEPYVRVLARTPQQGWTPEQIVRNFLNASASFQDDHGVARQYLAPSVRSQWAPESSVDVYDAGPSSRLIVEQSSGDNAVVTLEADHLATISSRGQYTAEPPGSRLKAVFRLRKIAGEWRIVNHPSGLMLTEQDVERAYRTRNLYFFDPTFQSLVPNPIYLPAGNREDLPTELTRALLRGATEWLAPAVKNAFPAGSILVEEVQVSSGRATVVLGGAAIRAGPKQVASMSAQLAWTLGQLRAVETVRLKIDGETVHVRSAGETVSMDDWASLDPGGTSGTVHGYVVRDKTLLVTTQDGLRPAPGPAGSQNVPVHSPAVSLDAKHVAWVSTSEQKLFVGQLREGGTYDVRLTGAGLQSLTWDRYGNLWVVEGAGKRSVVWMLEDGVRPIRVDLSELEAKNVQVRALRVARDGTRVAMIIDSKGDSRVLLGRIERADDAVRVADLKLIPTKLAQVTDVAWHDADELAVVGKDPQGVLAPYLVRVDGTSVSSVGGTGEAVSIAAAPHVPILVERKDSEIWRYQDTLRWELVAGGSQPVYPG